MPPERHSPHGIWPRPKGLGRITARILRQRTVSLPIADDLRNAVRKTPPPHSARARPLARLLDCFFPLFGFGLTLDASSLRDARSLAMPQAARPPAPARRGTGGRSPRPSLIRRSSQRRMAQLAACPHHRHRSRPATGAQSPHERASLLWFEALCQRIDQRAAASEQHRRVRKRRQPLDEPGDDRGHGDRVAPHCQ